MTCALKIRNSVAENTVPVTVVPLTLSQAPVVLEGRIRRRQVPTKSPTKTFSVASFSSSRFFLPSRLSSQIPRRWSALDNPPPPQSRPVLAPCLLAENLVTYLLLMKLDSGVPIRISLLSSYLEFLRWVRGIFPFRRKYEAKKVTKSFSPLPQTRPLYPR